PLEAPTVEHQRIAAEVGVSCQAEFAKYRDWLAANGKRQKNEEAGFRNWLRRAAEFKPKTSRTDLRQNVVSEILGATNAKPDRDITADS
ncbi:hypothetical protein, partial [Escherichia coli]|uniref:hypothetical protein n=1 Tax=Escherichia coli TaxID=562 RepID=UPI003D085BB4